MNLFWVNVSFSFFLFNYRSVKLILLIRLLILLSRELNPLLVKSVFMDPQNGLWRSHLSTADQSLPAVQ